MKKMKMRLGLTRETLRVIDARLDAVVGGIPTVGFACGGQPPPQTNDTACTASLQCGSSAGHACTQ